MEIIHENVKNYYGKELSSSADLKTNACCTLEEPSEKIKMAMSRIHDEILNKYYGCGLVIPEELEGLRILDLGCGAGRDCYILSQLVGATGEVIGVDMTVEQLAVAQKHIDGHMDHFGYDRANVRFTTGNIEAMDELGLEEDSFDLIISNCVINLTSDKEKVLKDVYSLLKPGGEMYFSDVFSDRRINEDLRKDSLLWVECLSGALYWNDFLRMARKAGFNDPRSIKQNQILIEDNATLDKCGEIQFFSVTYRLWKIEELEDACEDYGQAVSYKGTMDDHQYSFDLDDHHNFPSGKIMPVCGNTFLMLKSTRFSKHFEFYGTWKTHYGIYEGCGGAMPFDTQIRDKSVTSCC